MKKVLIYVLLFFVASCGVKKENNPVVEQSSTTETTENSSEMASSDPYEVVLERPKYMPSETVLTDLVHTKLEVDFIWEKSQMNGVATITAKPHFYASNEIILDAKGMEINSVTMNGSTLEFSYINDVLNIQLDREYTKGENYTVVIDYLAKPDERTTGGSNAITSDKGLFFINPKALPNGKMPQIWTQGETESSSVWFPTIDAPNAKTTQEIFITVEDKYVTLSNGKLVSSQLLEGGKRVDHWSQELPHAPYLFMMGVGEFKVVKDTYKRPDGSEMAVNYYVEPEWESSARGIFGETPEMIKFFSELLGVEYPWDKYHQIVVRDYVSGAMENTGAVIFGDYVYRTDRELLDGNDQSTIAHELFHHWFGDLVTCESWSNLTLNESFANYSQYLWDEYRYGLDEADYNAEIEGDGYFRSASMQGYHDLVWFDYDDKEQMFDGHSYNKGGRILHMLRNYLGDDAFFASLNKYLTDNKFKTAEFHNLRLAFEEVSGEDLNWFFNQWYLGSGHPELKYSQVIDTLNHKLIVTVEQTQDLERSPIYRIPFEIAVFDEAGKHVHAVELDELKASFEFGYTGTLKAYIYDNQQMILSQKEESKSIDHFVNQYYLGERYMARKEALMNGVPEEVSELSDASQQLVLDALKDSFWHIRSLALGKVGQLKGTFASAAKEIVSGILKDDPKSDVRVAALSAIKALEVDTVALMTLLKGRVSEDRSYAVISVALRELAGVDTEEAMKLAETLQTEKSSKIVYGITQLYAVKGGPEKFDFIKSALNGKVVRGFDRLGVLNSLTIFLTRQDPQVAEKALDLYAKQSETGGMYMKMFLPQNLSYLNRHFSKKLNELEEELGAHEENNDALYADQTRKKIAAYERVQNSYMELAKRLEKKASEDDMHQEEGQGR
ncbi:M1 family metallopeptidase [Crocinitomicaceae bacterium]|nr:M1 family metallopeptidase [Crocinitomicaceae bacterium]